MAYGSGARRCYNATVRQPELHGRCKEPDVSCTNQAHKDTVSLCDELIEDGVMELVYCPREENGADIFTNALGKYVLQAHLQKLGVGPRR